MVHILRHYGYSIVFLAVFAEDLGLPLPSYLLILVRRYNEIPPNRPVVMYCT